MNFFIHLPFNPCFLVRSMVFDDCMECNAGLFCLEDLFEYVGVDSKSLEYDTSGDFFVP